MGGPRVGVVGSLHAPRGWRILYTSRFRGAELGESRALKKSRQRWEPVMGWGGGQNILDGSAFSWGVLHPIETM